MRHELRSMVFAITALFVIHNSLFMTPAFAQGDPIGQSQITPASPLYFLKSVREILELKFAGTTHIRAIRQLEFATRRIREVKSLSLSSRQDLIEPVLIRYLSHLQELKGIVNLQDEAFVEQVIQEVNLHMGILQKVYNQVSDRRALMSIRSTIHKISQWDQEFIDKLTLLPDSYPTDKIVKYKLIGCNFLLKEASASSLNEVERAVTAERAQKCLMTKS